MSSYNETPLKQRSRKANCEDIEERIADAKAINKRANIKIIYTDILMPISFIAIDCLEGERPESAFISVKHNLYSVAKNNEERFITQEGFIERYDEKTHSNAFNWLREHIQIIIAENGKLSSCFGKGAVSNDKCSDCSSNDMCVRDTSRDKKE